MIRSLDELAFMERLREEVAPQLQRDLANGLSPEQILEKYQSYVAARMVSTALFDGDSSRSTAASVNILDRIGGKPKEKKEIEHRLGKLPAQDLDALIASKLATLAGPDED